MYEPIEGRRAERLCPSAAGKSVLGFYVFTHQTIQVMANRRLYGCARVCGRHALRLKKTTI